jgi:uncharacterized membrane protein YqjE
MTILLRSYPRGLLIMIALVLSGLILVGLQILIFLMANRRLRITVAGGIGLLDVL